MNKKIHDLNLHEYIHINPNLSVIRVPSGWIYSEYVENGTGGNDMNAVFVPYSDEFNSQLVNNIPKPKMGDIKQ